MIARFKSWLDRRAASKRLAAFRAEQATRPVIDQGGSTEVYALFTPGEAQVAYDATVKAGLIDLSARIERCIPQGGKAVITRQERSLLIRALASHGVPNAALAVTTV